MSWETGYHEDLGKGRKMLGDCFLSVSGGVAERLQLGGERKSPKSRSDAERGLRNSTGPAGRSGPDGATESPSSRRVATRSSTDVPGPSRAKTVGTMANHGFR